MSQPTAPATSPVTGETIAPTAIPATAERDPAIRSEPIGDAPADIALWFRVQQFLSREAHLLDDNRFTDWLELFTDDVTYWLPVTGNRVMPDLDKATHPFGDLAHFEETKATLSARVKRLRTGLAWAESPPSRTRHLVSNIEVERIVEPAGQREELLVRSAFILYRTHMEYDEDIMGGCRTDVLRPVDRGFRIAHRSIRLDQAVLLAKNLAVFF